MGATEHKYERELISRKRWVILVNALLIFTQNQTRLFPKDGPWFGIFTGLVNSNAINILEVVLALPVGPPQP